MQIFFCLYTDDKPKIQTNNLPGKAREILPATAFEAKLSIQKVVTPNAQLDSNHNLVKQTLQASDIRSDPSVKGSMEWNPNAHDEWVQCENCKNWHMLPDDVTSASLPDKW